MNLPNKLTLMRILIVPIMLIISYISVLNEKMIFASVSIANLVNLILFIIASLTDLLDGKIARKNNLVTTFGKFADPLADKILVIVSMLILSKQAGHFIDELVPLYVLFVVVFREFTISGVRMLASASGKVLAASNLGKLKTATTMVSLCFLFFVGIDSGISTLFGNELHIIEITGLILLGIAAILTLVSGIDYILKNKKIIFESI